MAQDTPAMSASVKSLTDLLFSRLGSEGPEPLNPSLRADLVHSALDWMASRVAGQSKILIRPLTDGDNTLAVLEVLNEDRKSVV